MIISSLRLHDNLKFQHRLELMTPALLRFPIFKIFINKIFAAKLGKMEGRKFGDALLKMHICQICGKNFEQLKRLNEHNKRNPHNIRPQRRPDRHRIDKVYK